MDDTTVRYRYPRYNPSQRRKKKSAKNSTSLAQTVARQIFFSVLILLTVVILKNIDTPATNYITGKFQQAVFYDMEIRSVFDGAGNLFDRLIKGKILNPEEKRLDEDAVPVSLAASSGEVKGLYSAEENYCAGENFIIPANGEISSGFGERIHPIKNTVEFHKGIDIEGSKGDYIKASLSGIVIDYGSNPSYGNYVRIWHKKGLETLYAHCSSLTVGSRQEVKQGDIIGQVGDTGNAIGTHLHFEIWKDGEPVNPLEYINLKAN